MDSNTILSIIAGIVTGISTIYISKLYDFYITYDAMINEIEKNLLSISENFVFNVEYRIKNDPGDGNRWLPKDVSLKAANLLPRKVTIDGMPLVKVRVRSYLYQFLPDNAFMLFINKGFALGIENLQNITVFYNHCNKFNYKSQQLEEKIRGKLDSSEDAFYEIAELYSWYTHYKSEIDNEYINIKGLVESYKVYKTLLILFLGMTILEILISLCLFNSQIVAVLLG
jgi:hypothetical protein